MRRIGICGTDLHAFEGTQPYFNYPRILGHETNTYSSMGNANLDKEHPNYRLMLALLPPGDN